MRNFKTAVAAIAISLGLVACSGTSTVDLTSLLGSAAGKAFVTALGQNGTLLPSIQNAVETVNSGLNSNTAKAALNTVCYALPWADGALDLFGPAAKIDAVTIANVDGAVKALVAGPCANPPTDIAQAVREGVQLFVSIQSQLSSSGVPVVVPATH